MGELYDSRKAICSVVAAIDYRCEELIGEYLGNL